MTSAEYMLNRYYKRRAEAIEYLGGRCVDCGVASGLEFDHKDPAEKSFSVSKAFASMAKEKLYKEIDKCVLRCIACHAHMTAFQRLQGVDILGLPR